MIRWEVRGQVGLATMDRPERRNALDAGHCDDLRAHLEGSQDLRAVIVTGSGDRAFCSGADLARRTEDTGGGIEHGGGDTFRPAFEAMLDAIEDHPSPVIAAVNGAALGAGMQLAVACDLRVVSWSATFGIPATKLGVMISARNVQRLAQLVGLGPAHDLLVTGRTVHVEEASALGLVHRAVEEVHHAALHWAEEIAQLAPLSVRGHKRALKLLARAGGLRGDLDPAALGEIAELEAAAFASEDLQEGLAAFAEKRAPRFQGR